MIGRVRGQRELSAIRRHGERARVGALVVVRREAPVDRPCLAFAIGRRVGSAVVRNQLRRRLRGALGSIEREEPELLPAAEYLVVVERGDWSYREGRQWLKQALQDLTR